MPKQEPQIQATDSHTSTPQEREAVWRFITALYSQSDVEDDCLALQDTYGCDVVLLLFLVWLDRTAPDTSFRLEDALHVAEHAQASIRQHRAVRRAAKINAPQCYASLLKEELEMEKAELFRLLDARNAAINKAGQASAMPPHRTAHRASFASAYAAMLGCTLPVWATVR